MHQLGFSFIKDYKKEFGGSLLLGKRKSKRPLSTKHPIHLVLKTTNARLLSPRNHSLQNLIQSQAKKFNLKLYDFAVNWTHIHLVIRLRRREDYQAFIRSLTSILTLRIQKARPEIRKIFTLRPYTRVISWGRHLRLLLHYQTLNQMESMGILQRTKKPKIRSEKRGGPKVEPPSLSSAKPRLTVFRGPVFSAKTLAFPS